MNAQFLAIVNIIVYAGAIMVLFLFVIMLMNLNAEAEPPKNIYLKMAGIIAGLCLMIVIIAAISSSTSNKVVLQGGTSVGLIKDLGMALFKDYLIPFEISSVLFLSAMIGAVVIGKKEQIKSVINEKQFYDHSITVCRIIFCKNIRLRKSILIILILMIL